MSNAFANASNAYNSAASAVAKRTGFLNGFKEFISRGNAVELAVGIVIGAAFTSVVTAIVEGLINPLIGGLFGQPNLDNIWTISLGDALIKPGMVLTALINFLLVAAAIYFIVVLPLNALAAKRKAGAEPEPEAPAEDVILLQEIRDLLKAPAGGAGRTAVPPAPVPPAPGGPILPGAPTA
ncbi:MAG TPA: large conductance mechanosensitive channel protein MscL [Micrococcales bacterium]|uniref:large conductance mechanosensitive channel protein MscL n=1 Tax=Miniimonas TaxID=947525 RepID=UPI000D526444|nr:MULTISPECIES: large conductance mechanosensitive channel protein MscL [Miniimonas]HCX85312.1 large conductance mechanosensitive channel protein MscL [Micrococcales bacterium]